MVMGKSATVENQPTANASTRLVSLDVMRGFDMFWIIGGSTLVAAIVQWLNWGWLNPFADQMHHVKWNGFAQHDLIFPMFIFITGVTMPFSFGKHLREGYSRPKLYWRIIRRALLLLLLGAIYNGLLKKGFSETRYLSVLGMIGMAYFWAALVVINFRPRGQLIFAIGILIGYWLLMTFVPVPGMGPEYSRPREISLRISIGLWSLASCTKGTSTRKGS